MTAEPSPATLNADAAGMARAIREGRFPEWFADFWTAHGVVDGLSIERPWLMAFCSEFAAAMEARCRSRSTKLNRLAKRLARESFGGDPGAGYFHIWVCDLQRLAADDTDICTPARAFGRFCEIVDLCRKAGIAYELDVVTELAALTLRGRGVSATDVRRAVSDHTEGAPLEVWLAARVDDSQTVNKSLEPVAE